MSNVDIQVSSCKLIIKNFARRKYVHMLKNQSMPLVLRQNELHDKSYHDFKFSFCFSELFHIFPQNLSLFPKKSKHKLVWFQFRERVGKTNNRTANKVYKEGKYLSIFQPCMECSINVSISPPDCLTANTVMFHTHKLPRA